VTVSEVRFTILPYRTHRRALELDSVEDYETILLRLAAEERGYVVTVPAAAAERCRKELAEPNPDLCVLDEIGEAMLHMTPVVALRVVADEPAAGAPAPRAPEKPAPAPAPPPPKARAPAPESRIPTPESRIPAVESRIPAVEPRVPTPDSRVPAVESRIPSAEPKMPAETATSCRECRNPLPADRQVVFCPWCGKRLIPFTCARCGTELNSEWKHCITCGAPVKDPYRFA
jgi:predicted RNA-binding Zn-ribbon protein involved in translation (DUF1610 family)